ncbi:MAG: LysR family transcriptional regulator [Caulobacterales bacterium]|nr:LysR family transcriptional regulator [Caulobacterales bacterium]
MDRFAALSAFVAVVEQGGFAPAARRMGLATSSLTRQVNALEEHLGALLVNRSTRAVTLTDAGARYLEDARRILGELEEADRGVSEAEGPPSGVLRASLPVAFARLHVAPAIPAFLRRYPDVELDMLTTDAMVNLVEDRIDVAIRLGALESSSLIARTLAAHRRVVCASPDYLGERGRPAAPADLANHNCLAFDYATGGASWHFSRGKTVETVRVRGNLKASGSELLQEAALGGAGIILMPTWLVGPDIAAGRLVQILPGWEANPSASPGAISAVYSPNRRGAKKVRAFVDHLAEQFGSPPYWECG